MRRGYASAAGALIVAALLALAPGASAATIKVGTTLDEFGGPGGAGCALREAVQAANTNHRFGGCKRKGSGNADTIELKGGSFYQDNRAGVDEANETGDLDFEGKSRIQVRGEGKATLDGNDIDRVIDVLKGAKLIASRLIVQNGAVPVPGGPEVGGGIRNNGTLELRASAVVANQLPNDLNTAGGGIGAGDDAKETKLERVVVNDNDASIADGGGISVYGGTLTINGSTISSNEASDGAGLFLVADESVRMTNSTVSDNEASGEFTGGGAMFVSGALVKGTNVTVSGNSSNTRGGGIYSIGGTVELNAATITDNTADANANGGGTLGGSGGGFTGDAPLKLKNSVVAGNLATNASDADCDGGATLSHTLVGIDTGCFGGATNIATLNPMLAPLADNGGPTETHELLEGSPAIGNAGKKSAPKRDQRGHRRDKHPDIGAFER